MNERVQELGRQAGFAFIEDGVYGQRWYQSKCGMDRAEFEKFAELIQQDCLQHLTNTGQDHAREILERYFAQR